MDKDDSGALDAAEIHKCLGELDVKCSIRDTKKMIAAADIDGNGDIDLDEAHTAHSFEVEFAVTRHVRRCSLAASPLRERNQPRRGPATSSSR